jgi:Ca-activated chloride channel family protein
MIKFSSPAWLVLLIVVAALAAGYVILQLRRKKYVARFSNVALLASVAPRRPGWRRHLTFVLLLAALAVLSVGVARPTAAVKVPRDRATVMLAVDVSESMQATDVLPSRIEAAKAAAKTFAEILPARINLGLVKFGGSAAVVLPPTIDRDAMKNSIDTLELESSTAIGDAVFASLDALKSFEKSTTAKGDSPPPMRIVLLSDGANNKGRSVSDAIAEAKKDGVAVSTIAFGTDSGTVTIDGETVPVPADKTTLSELASQTGGSFHTAASEQELASVYKDIGSQIGYTTARKDISWRFLVIGLLLALGSAASAMLWSGRLL